MSVLTAVPGSSTFPMPGRRKGCYAVVDSFTISGKSELHSSSDFVIAGSNQNGILCLLVRFSCAAVETDRLLPLLSAFGKVAECWEFHVRWGRNVGAGLDCESYTLALLRSGG